MTDQDYRDFDGDRETPPGRPGFSLPGGVSLQTAATVLLVVVLVTILWLFFGPTGSDAPPNLPTATTVAGGPTGTPVLAGAVPAAGTPIAGGGNVMTGTVVASSADSTTPANPANPGAAANPPPATPPAAGSVPAAPAEVGTPGALLSDNSFVRVANTDGYGLRLRFSPGLDTLTIRIVPDGSILHVMGSPESGGGQRWYRLQDELGNVGWAADTFISPVAAPANWNPPVASPTFEADAGALGSVQATATP